MRVALIYPPPWKIAAAGQPAFPPGQGPPSDFLPGDLDADFFQVPYGLLSLASVAIDAGHQARVLNLSGFAWDDVLSSLSKLRADVFGLSCWTANRRGVLMTAEAIRDLHPQAHIVVGGPHATPFASQLLEKCDAIDTVALGESEGTFLELLQRLAVGKPTTAIEGTAFRSGAEVALAGKRAALRQLDQLTAPQAYFPTHIMMTSRGCPWQCTFCGAETTWGRGFRGHSVSYVVDALEQALSKLPVRMIQIKDDTFTANKKRALAICREIQNRGLRFLWSCDTRVDVLDEELLLEMRLAGCQRLSLGVESGSAQILKNIDKKITLDEIIEATELAKSVGIQVRYFMMLGNRGETIETFAETRRFLDRAAPHSFVFSCLSVYPGTRDFDAAVEQGWLDPAVFFEQDFQEFKTPFDADEATTSALSDWFAKNRGVNRHYQEDVPAALAIIDKVGDYGPAHLEAAAAFYRAGELDAAARHAKLALDREHPTPGLAYNALAVIAWARGDIESMKELLLRAAKIDPQHQVLIENVNKVRAWFRHQGPERALPLDLELRTDFQLLERTLQPTLPGPLEEDFADWSASPQPVPRHFPESADVTPERYGKQGFSARRLRVLS